MAIDKDPSRSKQVHIVQYDLVDEAQRNSLLQLIDKEGPSILWAHFAPSCGTASRSRERPLKKFEDMGFNIPKPLRSDAFPLELPNLQGLDREKVLIGNETYKAMVEVAERCLRWGIAISIENPGNSLFWKIPFILAFLNRVQGFDAVFHHCAHGGLRDKLTRWWASVGWFLPLAILCDKPHYHAPWNPTVKGGRLAYPTHEEAAYPVLLCTRLAGIALQCGAIPRSSTTSGFHKHYFAEVFAGHATRGKKFRPLVSEYGHYVLVATAAVKTQPSLPLQSFPKGAKIVHRRLHRGQVRVDQECKLKEPVKNSGDVVHGEVLTVGHIIDGPEDGLSWEICSVGIPREPVDFIKAAFKAGRPRTMAIHLADDIKQVLMENFGEEQCELSKKRLDFIRKWSNRAKELQEEEAKYHDSLPKHLQVILKGKRLLLLKEISQDIEYPDRDLVRHISDGFSISGCLYRESSHKN